MARGEILERPKEMPPLCGCEYWQTQKIGEQGAIQCQHDECRGLGATRGSTHAFVLHAVTLAQWVEKCWIFRSCREQRCAHLLHLVVGHRFHLARQPGVRISGKPALVIGLYRVERPDHLVDQCHEQIAFGLEVIEKRPFAQPGPHNDGVQCQATGTFLQHQFAGGLQDAVASSLGSLLEAGLRIGAAMGSGRGGATLFSRGAAWSCSKKA